MICSNSRIWSLSPISEVNEKKDFLSSFSHIPVASNTPPITNSAKLKRHRMYLAQELPTERAISALDSDVAEVAPYQTDTAVHQLAAQNISNFVALNVPTHKILNTPVHDDHV